MFNTPPLPTIINPNVNGYSMEVRWNQFLGTFVVDVFERDNLVRGGKPLIMGDQSIWDGVRAIVTSDRNNCDFLDQMVNSTIEFYSGCSRGFI